MEVRKTVLVAHSARQMFDLIEAAEHYPDFLPWCAAATIVARDETVVSADVTVDYHGVRFRFRTRNPKRAPEWMAIHLEHGPFHQFEGEWRLTPLATDGCRIDFLLRYDFKRSITSRLAGPVFDRIANTMVDAFVARADRVYALHGADRALSASPAITPVPAPPPAPAPAPSPAPAFAAQPGIPPASAAPEATPFQTSPPAAADGDSERSDTR